MFGGAVHDEDDENPQSSSANARPTKGPDDRDDRASEPESFAQHPDVIRAPSGGMEQDGQGDTQGDGLRQVSSTLALTRMELTSGPLPPASEFARYEQVLPGAADRILAMAEQSLQAEIDGQKDTRKIYAADRQAENWCLKFASTVFSLLIVAAFIAAVLFSVLGRNSEAIISTLCFLACVLPRIIDAVKGRKTGENISMTDTDSQS